MLYCSDNQQSAPYEKNGVGGRFHAFDKLKVLCAFLVVCIHASFPGAVGTYVTGVSRIAVPAFFMISGFFWTKSGFKKQAWKVFKLLLIANTLFLCYRLAIAFFGDGVIIYLKKTITIESICRFLAFNVSPFAAHLWYISAILYVLIVFQAAEKLHLQHKLVYLTPLLLIVNLAIGKYSFLFFKSDIPIFYSRNWLLTGLPFFSLGYYIRNKRELVEKHIHKTRLLIAMLVFLLASILESYIFVNHLYDETGDIGITCCFLTVTVFLLFLSFIDQRQNRISQVGRQDSTWVYILHYMLIRAMNYIAGKLDINAVYKAVRPVIVFVITVMLV